MIKERMMSAAVSAMAMLVIGVTGVMPAAALAAPKGPHAVPPSAVPSGITNSDNGATNAAVNANSLSVTPFVDAAVARLDVFAITSGAASSVNMNGHAWITVKNLTSGNLVIGLVTIPAGGTMSFGTWGNQPEHNGLWYNLEPYLNNYNLMNFSGRINVGYLLSQTQLNNLNNYIAQNDYWSLTTNCSSFATGAWNTAVGYGSGYTLSAGYPNTPTNLYYNIKSTFPTYWGTDYQLPYQYRVMIAHGAFSWPTLSTSHVNGQ